MHRLPQTKDVTFYEFDVAAAPISDRKRFCAGFTAWRFQTGVYRLPYDKRMARDEGADGF
jgi:hypothetical protein